MMKTIKPTSVSSYGSNVVIIKVDEYLGERYDYLALNNDNVKLHPRNEKLVEHDWYVLMNVNIQDTIPGSGDAGNMIGLNYNESIGMDHKPIEEDVIKELI